jgi:imidazolonepropionase
MLIIKNIKEVFLGKEGIVKDAAIVVEGEKIIAAGDQKEILKKLKPGKKDTVLDAKGKIALPGFVDCHTHLVYGGSRADEFEVKLKGQSYAELHNKKGGIYLTVEETRKASEKELFLNAKKLLDEMFLRGTTTVEIKSGYGLDFENEIKMLRVIQKLKKTAKQDIVATFLGAHTVPSEFQGDRMGYVREITEKMLPYIKQNGLAEFVDVFCDPLGFTIEETKEIFSAAQKMGFKLRVHAEQTTRCGGAQLAAQFGAVSCEHCDFLSDEDVKKLKESKTIPVFLPGVLFHLAEWDKLPHFAEMIAKIRRERMTFAIATDYNPGSSPMFSMKLMMDMALRFYKMDYFDCVRAATFGGAAALGRADIGSIEEGKQADILLIDAPSIKDYLHQAGDRKIGSIIKRGEVITL